MTTRLVNLTAPPLLKIFWIRYCSTRHNPRPHIIYTLMIYQMCANNLRMYRLFADDAKFYSDEDALPSLVYVPYKNVQINDFLG